MFTCKTLICRDGVHRFKPRPDPKRLPNVKLPCADVHSGSAGGRRRFASFHKSHSSKVNGFFKFSGGFSCIRYDIVAFSRHEIFKFCAI
jgi:hypothetical protein